MRQRREARWRGKRLLSAERRQPLLLSGGFAYRRSRYEALIGGLVDSLPAGRILLLVATDRSIGTDGRQEYYTQSNRASFIMREPRLLNAIVGTTAHSKR